jgi:hypothetical protein
MMDLLELQHELNELQEERNQEMNNNYSYIKARIASQQSRNRSIDILLKEGNLEPCKVSEILEVPVDIVKARVAELERDEAEKDEFLATGQLPQLERGGVVSIFK